MARKIYIPYVLRKMIIERLKENTTLGSFACLAFDRNTAGTPNHEDNVHIYDLLVKCDPIYVAAALGICCKQLQPKKIMDCYNTVVTVIEDYLDDLDGDVYATEGVDEQLYMKVTSYRLLVMKIEERFVDFISGWTQIDEDHRAVGLLEDVVINEIHEVIHDGETCYSEYIEADSEDEIISTELVTLDDESRGELTQRINGIKVQFDLAGESVKNAWIPDMVDTLLDTLIPIEH